MTNTYKKVIKLYKKVGETPLECLEKFRGKNPEYEDLPMTYAGRLDPMAEGLLLVLAGDECKKKDEYLGLDKEYEGEILFGFSTDTGDVLGIPKHLQISDSRFKNQDFNYSRILSNSRIVEEGAGSLAGKRTQRYPAFSSKTVEGKPLWQWTREEEDVRRPEREIEVYSFEITDCRTEKHSNILQNVGMSVNKVKGDFRQDDILEKWEEVLSGEGKALICKFKTEVSSGTYIRGLAEELGEKLGTEVYPNTFSDENLPKAKGAKRIIRKGVGALLYSLKRTKIGKYSLV